MRPRIEDSIGGKCNINLSTSLPSPLSLFFFFSPSIQMINLFKGNKNRRNVYKNIVCQAFTVEPDCIIERMTKNATKFTETAKE